MVDALVFDLSRQDIINTDNHLMNFSDSSWKFFQTIAELPNSYIPFYQGRPIDHGTHVSVPVAQWSAESEYNAACTEGMALAHLRMLIHELLIKDPDIAT